MIEYSAEDHKTRIMQPYKVYIVNLNKRPDRRKSVLHEFQQRDEYSIHVVEGIEHSIGAIGLWNGIIRIVNDMIEDEDEFIIICEDDHQFTSDYSKYKFLQCIHEAKNHNADVLMGGISGFTSAIQISEHLYWVEKFSGLQFTVIFRKFFQEILNADFVLGDAADYKMCELTDNKFFMYPFISIQKDFGYSDATPKNNVAGRVEELFMQSETKIRMLKKVTAFYRHIEGNKERKPETVSCENIVIPTYIIHSPEQTGRRKNMEEQFYGRDEFDIKIVEACPHKIEAVGQWLSIRKVIEMAFRNDDDVILICRDDHEFTESYSKDSFIKNIIEAHEQYADYISGGIVSFEVALPILDNLFWISPCLSTQFLVIYKRFFNKILNEPFDDAVVPGLLLSELTSNKMLLFPFISRKKDFHDADSTLMNDLKGSINNNFLESSKRLEVIQKAYFKYGKGFYRTLNDKCISTINPNK